MKAIGMQIQKSSRWAAMLLAAVVGIITSAVVANATQTITTPNAVKITYNLAAGASSAAITPVTNTSVLVMGCSTTASQFTSPGVGQVTLLHIPSGGMVWAGYESGDTATFYGAATTVGTHIVYIGADHEVDIQVASADTIRVHNGSSSTQAGNVTLIW